MSHIYLHNRLDSLQRKLEALGFPTKKRPLAGIEVAYCTMGGQWIPGRVCHRV